MKRHLFVMALVLAVPTIALAQNCCMPSLSDDEGGGRLIEGIQWATLALLVPLFSIFSFGVIWVVRRLPSQEIEDPETGHGEI